MEVAEIANEATTKAIIRCPAQAEPLFSLSQKAKDDVRRTASKAAIPRGNLMVSKMDKINLLKDVKKAVDNATTGKGPSAAEKAAKAASKEAIIKSVHKAASAASKEAAQKGKSDE